MHFGTLYFIKDDFYSRFPDCNLMVNKPSDDGSPHSRPCCCLFKSPSSNLYWMVPISSQIFKYHFQYHYALQKYRLCDNISFGYVLGKKRAFLIQNLFPVTEEYIEKAYLDANTDAPIHIPQSLLGDLCRKARKKIRFNKAGKLFGLTDIVKIEQLLLLNHSDSR